MTPDSAVQLVRELGERASPMPWRLEERAYAEGFDTYVMSGDVDIMELGLVVGDIEVDIANAAYTALAVNNIGLVLEALEGTNQELRMRHVTLYSARIEECDEAHRHACGVCLAAASASAALAAVAEAAKKVLS